MHIYDSIHLYLMSMNSLQRQCLTSIILKTFFIVFIYLCVCSLKNCGIVKHKQKFRSYKQILLYFKSRKIINFNTCCVLSQKILISVLILNKYLRQNRRMTHTATETKKLLQMFVALFGFYYFTVIYLF